jgi:uncharacterized damage-inducible protein DinB
MDNLVQHVHDILTANSKRWQALVEISPELLHRPAAAGEWSAVQCLQHLIDAERAIFPARIDHILAGRDFPGFNPNTQGTKPSDDVSPRAMGQEYADLRVEALKVLARVTPDDLVKTARHGELGVVTMGELIHEWAAHDLMHTVQAERAVMQPFIAECGPWRHYFVDHEIVSEAK